jgi:hypothetical protein
VKTFLLVGALSVSALLAAAPHNWKTGTLVESAEARETTGGGGGPIAIARSSSGQSSNPASDPGEFATAAAIAANRQRTYVSQGFVIQGGGYVFMVRRRMTGRHQPNVTIHGPIKYTLENGKFYIQDEDGREFQMIVMKKALDH